MNVRINWSRLLDNELLNVQYRACSESHAWRKPPKHGSLRRALFGEFGARELFRDGSKLNRERSKSYGNPIFVAVWVDGEPWAILVKERVAAIIPLSDLADYEESKAKIRKTHAFSKQVAGELELVFDRATKHLLLDEQYFYQPIELDLMGTTISENNGPNDDSERDSRNTSQTINSDNDKANDELANYWQDLEREINLSLADRDSRSLRLEQANKKPEVRKLITTIYTRNPDVIAEVLDRSNGICGECGSNAPFLRTTNGTPYLEVHHRRPLSEGGEDTVQNAVALCPNCHRKFHYGK